MVNDRRTDSKLNPKNVTHLKDTVRAAPKTPSVPALVPPPRSLSFKEKRVLEFLETFMGRKGIAPSYQEICQYFGFASINSAQRYLKQLEAKGYIHMPGGNQKRAITVIQASSALKETVGEMQRDFDAPPLPTPLNPEALTLPLLGRVAAGAPIEAFEHDEFIDVPASLVRHADRTYALRVQGQSMIEDGILDGDVILVQRQSNAGSGEIIVAVVDGEATVKRLYFGLNDEGEKLIELRPANSSMQSFWHSPRDVEIRGIVVGLIRQF